MKNQFIFFFACISSLQIFAQGEANNWYFGNNAGITFNTNPPSSITDGQLSTTEGCSSISDSGGNLLFYTDGRTIWDKNHQVMPNGNYFSGTGLHGDPSSTQSGLIVPHPTESGIYFVFTVDEPHHQNANAYPNQGPADDNENSLPNYEEGEQFIVPQEDDGFNNGFNYSVVDMSLRNGLGDVVDGERNNHLVTYDENDPEEIKYQCSEKISAVTGADCNSIWVITHFVNRFYAFLIDEDGVDENPVISETIPSISLNSYRRNAIGYIKASPDGKKLLSANTQTTNATSPNGNVYLYDFDNATGIVSNPLQLASNVRPYGVEFSPNSTKAYASLSSGDSPTEIYQWNLTANNIPSSVYSFETSSPQATAMQLGPNGKIYIPKINAATLHVINNPDEDGPNIDFQEITPLGAISLQGRISLFGLPPFIQSIFTSRVDIISGENESGNNFNIETEISICGDETFTLGNQYESDATYQWFENGEAIEGETTPFLEISLPENEQAPYSTAYTLDIFPESGECKLSGIANVIFGENPDLSETTLVQCLTDFENESAFFNLNNARPSLVEATNLLVEDFEFEFYESTADLNEGIAIENILEYENTSNPQTIVIEVVNRETRCKNSASIQLIVDDIDGTEEIDLFECDTNLDGFQEFNLELAAEETDLTPTFFYSSINDALQDENRITNTTAFSNTEAYLQTIYFRTASDANCGILGILDLRITDLPFLFDDQEVFYCIEDSPETISIQPSVPANSVADYIYFWPATNEETFSVEINEPDTYQVVVTEIETGCESIQNIVVRNSSLANFQVNIDDGNETSNQIEISVDETESIGNYEFTLDNALSNYQDSPIFSDLQPGLYEVFVRDKNGCGISKRSIGVIGAMQFFTPNNDGVNDFWNLTGLPANQKAQIWVFDRFGKLLVEFDAQSSRGWDGTYNGKLMANNDYWYQVKLSDGRILKGNFTLKR